LLNGHEWQKKSEKEIYKHFFERFKLIAEKRIGAKDAEDIAQDACVIMIKKYKTESYAKNFEAWAYTILRNKIGNYMQKHMNKSKTFIPESEMARALRSPSPESAIGLKKRLIDCIKKMIKKNPMYARTVNFIYQGYNTDEISRKMGVNLKNLYMILNRGRRMLKTCLNSGRLRT